MILDRTPLRRWGTPADFEGVAVFLASEASSYMTGSEIHIDGGLLAS
jgi:2-deoxy-D-gluconate 3-dehydrogenase